MTEQEIQQVVTALKAASDHLEYCGYGDAWERECATTEGLPKQIEDALRVAGVEEDRAVGDGG